MNDDAIDMKRARKVYKHQRKLGETRSFRCWARRVYKDERAHLHGKLGQIVSWR